MTEDAILTLGSASTVAAALALGAANKHICDDLGVSCTGGKPCASLPVPETDWLLLLLLFHVVLGVGKEDEMWKRAAFLGGEGRKGS